MISFISDVLANPTETAFAMASYCAAIWAVIYGIIFAVVLAAISAKIVSMLTSHVTSPSTHLRPIPFASGRYPIIGHVIQFKQNVPEFLAKCMRETLDTTNNTKRCEGVFKIKLFNKTIALIADHNLIAEFFAAKESDMSMWVVLKQLFFADGFSDDPERMNTIISLVKQTIQVRFAEFIPIIMDEAREACARLADSTNGNENVPQQLKLHMTKFIARTSCLSFVGIPMGDEFFDALADFSAYLNRIVPATYMLPMWLLRRIHCRELRRLRSKVIIHFIGEVRKHQDDATYCSSKIMRTFADHIDASNGRKLTDSQICEAIICLLFVSTENTAFGLVATIVDLVSSEWMPKVVKRSNEIFSYHHQNSCLDAAGKSAAIANAILADPLINACVMESARLNAHSFSLMRRPMNKQSLGSYYIGDADVVALCLPLLMSLDQSRKNINFPYKDAATYNPGRFLSPFAPESMQSRDLLTWGAGTHICPGKQFAVYEIKIALAYLAINFEFKPAGNKLINYFSSSAFAEVNQPMFISIVKNRLWSPTILNHANDATSYLFCGALGVKAQEALYSALQDNSVLDTRAIIRSNPLHSTPFAYNNHLYTGKSNLNRIRFDQQMRDNGVADIIDECSKIVVGYSATCATDCGAQNCNRCESYWRKLIPTSDANSIYSSLFGPRATMSAHTDEGCNWGISVSLGSSCNFVLGEHRISLKSGDILIADFGSILHEVVNVNVDDAPEWWTNATTYGKARASIQLRNIQPRQASELISDTEFIKKLAHSNMLELKGLTP